MKKTIKPLLSLIFLTISAPAFAHEDWIEPNEFRLEKTEKKQLPYTLGFDITASDSYLNADRNRILEDFGGFKLTITDPNGSRVDPNSLYLNKLKTTGEVTLAQKGTYVLALNRTSDPMYYSELKTAAGGLEYVVLPKDRLSAEQRSRWNETGAYYFNAKTYIQVETASDGWKKPLGHNKEILPLSNLNSIQANQPFDVQVLFNGAPMPSATIRLVHQGYEATEYGGAPVKLAADENGKAKINFDTPGRWLIESHHNVKHDDTAKAGKTKYAAVLMVEVLP